MATLEALRKRREEILSEIRGLEAIRRGSMTQQYFEATGTDGTKSKRGPYPLYTFKEKGKTISRRIPKPDLVSTYKAQILGHQRFEELISELVRIGEEISDMLMEAPEEKKTSPPRSRSRKTPK